MPVAPPRSWIRVGPALALALVALGFGAERAAHAQSATLVNVPPTPHRGLPGVPLAHVAEAVRSAAEAAGWRIESEEPGASVASIWVRNKHRAVVRIGYDDEDFWIDYVSSHNLDYTTEDRPPRYKGGRTLPGPRIHRNYNGWVKRLAKRIRTSEVRRAEDPAPAPADATAAEATDAPDATPAAPPLVADELAKLHQLLERGVLSQAEFDAQKAKLLAR